MTRGAWPSLRLTTSWSTRMSVASTVVFAPIPPQPFASVIHVGPLTVLSKLPTRIHILTARAASRSSTTASSRTTSNSGRSSWSGATGLNQKPTVMLSPI
jgi:hypothetical protein